MLDLITVETAWKRIISILDESCITMVRTAFSSVVRDFHDFAAGLTDSKGQIIAQASRVTPGLVGVLPNGVRNFMKHFPLEELEPRDVLATNDPWLVSGHNMDITMATPIFHRGNFIGFSLVIVHHADMGGSMASVDCRDTYEEGLKIPMVKLARAGIPNEDAFNFIRHNVRVSERVVGDIRAQMSVNYLITNRMIELLDELGWHDFDELSKEILGRSESSMRGEISQIPDGRYQHTRDLDPAETGGVEEPITVVLTVEVNGDEIICDYDGTSPQIRKGINSILEALTWSYTYFGLKCVLDPSIPNNEGSFRPVTVKAPLGSILNARFPAPTVGRTAVCTFLPEVIFFALESVMPDRVIGGCGATPHWACTFSGRNEVSDSEFLELVSHQGGMGASIHRDGMSTMTFPVNTSNIPIEVTEAESPLLYEKKEFITDSGGAGKHRGGLGQEVILYYPPPSGQMSPSSPILGGMRGGRFNHVIPGIQGGGDSMKSELLINDKKVRSNRQLLLHPGDRLVWRVSGGGGYGDPYDRDISYVVSDFRNGLVSRKGAPKYGVVINEETGVDIEKTIEFRRRRKEKKQII
jgi:N-methylhydantoinase B/oxoprolinase/acetone carboxylase alpha subunit